MKKKKDNNNNKKKQLCFLMKKEETCLGGSFTPAPGIHFFQRVWNDRVEVSFQIPSLGVASVQTPPLRKPAKEIPLPRDTQDHSQGVFKLPSQRTNKWFSGLPFSSPLWGLKSRLEEFASIRSRLFKIWFDLV